MVNITILIQTNLIMVMIRMFVRVEALWHSFHCSTVFLGTKWVALRNYRRGFRSWPLSEINDSSSYIDVYFHHITNTLFLLASCGAVVLTRKYEDLTTYSGTLHVQRRSHLASLHWGGQKNQLVRYCLTSTTHDCCQTRWTCRVPEYVVRSS